MSEEKKGGWSLIETAPRDGTHVLLFSPDSVAPQITVGFWMDDNAFPGGGAWWDSWNQRFPIDADSSHWMPLPSLPRI